MTLVEEVNLIAIETARDACGVVVLCSDGRVASATTLRPRTHAEKLVPMAVRTVAKAGLRFGDIDAVAVSAGPGSYTGLRIGVSAAKGFATAYGARFIGVPTPLAYARSISRDRRLRRLDVDLIAIALQARRSEIYFAAFAAGDSGGVPTTIVNSCVVECAEAADRLVSMAGERTVHIGGDAAAAVLNEINQKLNAHEAQPLPGAIDIGRIGLDRYRKGHFDDLRSFEPFYLKDYIAKQGGSVFDRLHAL